MHQAYAPSSTDRQQRSSVAICMSWEAMGGGCTADTEMAILSWNWRTGSTIDGKLPSWIFWTDTVRILHCVIWLPDSFSCPLPPRLPPSSYRLMAIDHDLFSFVDVALDQWPVVMVTNPKDARFMVPRTEPIGRIRHSTHIRQVGWTVGLSYQ